PAPTLSRLGEVRRGGRREQLAVADQHDAPARFRRRFRFLSRFAHGRVPSLLSIQSTITAQQYRSHPPSVKHGRTETGLLRRRVGFIMANHGWIRLTGQFSKGG